MVIEYIVHKRGCINVEEIKAKLEEMKKSIKGMNSENDYKYSDGWRDGIEFAIERIEKCIQR